MKTYLIGSAILAAAFAATLPLEAQQAPQRPGSKSVAAITGDAHPIHYDREYAMKTRFGERIVHGLYTASLISTVIGMYLPGPGAVYLSQTLNFRAPVKIGDVITVVVEIAELVEKGRRAKLKCECLVDGKVVLDGEALVMVPSREQATRAADKPASAG